MDTRTDHWQLLGLIERAAETVKGEPLCASCATARRAAAEPEPVLATA